MSNFLRIPSDLLHEIYIEWILLESLCVLDTAFCSRKNRHLFLTTIDNSINPFINTGGKFESIHFLDWLNSRKISVHSIRFRSKESMRQFSENEFLCQKLQRVTFNCPISPHENVFEFNFPELRFINPDCLPLEYIFNYLSNSKKLTSLRATARYFRNNETILNIATNYPTLTDINLSHSVGLTADAVLSLVINCKFLQKFNIKNCRLQSDALFAHIADHSNHLTALNIGDNTYVSSASILNIAEKCRKLIILNIEGCSLCDDFFEQLSKLCPLLESLQTSSIGSNRYDDLKLLCKRCVKLRNLQVCDKLDSQLAQIFADHCHNLQCLSTLYPGTSVEAVGKVLRNCKKVTSLAVTCIGLGGTFNIVNQLSPLFGKLKSLLFCFPVFDGVAAITPEGLCEFCSNCSKLTTLRINNGSNLSVELIPFIMKSMPLVQLVIYDSGLTTDAQKTLTKEYFGRVEFTKIEQRGTSDWD